MAGFLGACLSITIIIISLGLNGVSGTPEVPESKVEPPNYILPELGARLQGMSPDMDKSDDIGLRLKSTLEKISLEGYANFVSGLLKEGDPVDDNYGSSSSDLAMKVSQEELNKAVDDDGVLDFIQSLSAANNGSNTTTISPACLNDTGRLLRAIVQGERWVIPFLDSMGKPGPSLALYRWHFVGNYEQCRSAVSKDGENRTFKGNYCVVQAMPNIPGNTFLAVKLGACVPDSCSAQDLGLIEYEVLRMLNMTSKVIPLPPECRTDEREVTTATVFAIIFLAVIGAMMVMGTFYDVVIVQQLVSFKNPNDMISVNPSAPNEFSGESSGSGQSSEQTALLEKRNKSQSNQTIDRTMGACAKILLAFSVYTNGKKVLNTSQTPGSLGAVHGIRFLSMSWVILGHIYMYFITYSDNMAESFRPWLERWTSVPINNAFPSVDTFFAMSGLLTSYLTIKEMAKKSWKINWFLFYFHRFWRLTPPYMLVILISLGLQRFLGSGALWNTVQPVDKSGCENYWWTNLLYVNNLVGNKREEMCLGQSWYLANDMQFFVVSPLMLIPFYFNPLAGFASCVVFLLVTWITTGVLSAQNEWPTSTIEMTPRPGTATYFTDYYITPWCRIGPFVVGIMAGFILAITRGGKDLRMKWWIAVLGWVIATAAGLAVVYGLYGDISGDDVSSNSVAALYNAVARSVWGVCVCWVIVACASGYGGPVNSLLSWSPFVFLGKLTYMAYLIHLNIIAAYFMNRDSLEHANDTNIVILYLGLLVFVNMAAFVFMLGLESPMIGLERAFIRKQRRD